MAFDQTDLDRMTEEISELISLAPVGLADWIEIPRAITRWFPGSFSGLQNFDLVSNSLPFLAVDGIEDHHLTSYSNYYYSINPYEKYWRGHKDGQVWISDYVLPTKTLTYDEFYNDWMIKVGEFDSAIGVKLDATAENEIRLNLQFSPTLFDQYKAPVLQIFDRLQAPLRRAISISRHMEAQNLKIATQSALLERRNKPACIVDISGNLIDGNPDFETLLRRQNLFKLTHNHLSLIAGNMGEQFSSLIRQIGLLASAQNSKMVVRTDHGNWILSCSRLPAIMGQGPVIQQPMILILATFFGQTGTDLDLSGFRESFELTPSEERLCQALARGYSLSEAASALTITYETARSRIKDIFLKTGTSKQAELTVMLEKFRSS
ncbi:MAG: hypothetical protein N4A65_10110 [Cohaesibacter sp.]|nr:hypothetical protein [Cohaesibacter sp.]